jgi:hypothetical protein
MIYTYIVLLILAAGAAAITTLQAALTVFLRRWRRRGARSIFPAGRFGRTGAFRFDPEATLRTR